MFSTVKKGLFTFLVGLFAMMIQNCSTSKEQKDNFPRTADYPGYDLIDARHVQNISLDVQQGTKLAIVVRDLAVTAFSNLEKPVYDKKFVAFEGLDRCCVPTNGLIGASGLLVYKFQVLRPIKKTTSIKLISRHKGLDMNAAHYDSDLVTKIDLATP
jgi:hypothetical protein